jgi:hypothetical protein
MRRLGLLINGIEFVPAAIVDKHTPFGVPPGMEVEVAWTLSEAEVNLLIELDK